MSTEWFRFLSGSDSRSSPDILGNAPQSIAPARPTFVGLASLVYVCAYATHLAQTALPLQLHPSSPVDRILE